MDEAIPSGGADPRAKARRSLRFTAGSPFARAVRILLHELDREYDALELDGAPPVDESDASQTLQVPAFRDGPLLLQESGLIAEYLLRTYAEHPDRDPGLSTTLWRTEREWEDKRAFAAIQTVGAATTTISQMTRTGVTVTNDHLACTATRMDRILTWLEDRFPDDGGGFIPGRLSIHDVFLLSHVRFVQAPAPPGGPTAASGPQGVASSRSAGPEAERAGGPGPLAGTSE